MISKLKIIPLFFLICGLVTTMNPCIGMEEKTIRGHKVDKSMLLKSIDDSSPAMLPVSNDNYNVFNKGQQHLLPGQQSVFGQGKSSEIKPFSYKNMNNNIKMITTFGNNNPQNNKDNTNANIALEKQTNMQFHFLPSRQPKYEINNINNNDNYEYNVDEQFNHYGFNKFSSFSRQETELEKNKFDESELEKMRMLKGAEKREYQLRVLDRGWANQSDNMKKMNNWVQAGFKKTQGNYKTNEKNPFLKTETGTNNDKIRLLSKQLMNKKNPFLNKETGTDNDETRFLNKHLMTSKNNKNDLTPGFATKNAFEDQKLYNNEYNNTKIDNEKKLWLTTVQKKDKDVIRRFNEKWLMSSNNNKNISTPGVDTKNAFEAQKFDNTEDNNTKIDIMKLTKK